jgi:hypothetical protein
MFSFSVRKVSRKRVVPGRHVPVRRFGLFGASYVLNELLASRDQCLASFGIAEYSREDCAHRE